MNKYLFCLIMIFAAYQPIESMQKLSDIYAIFKPHITLKNTMLGTAGLGVAFSLLVPRIDLNCNEPYHDIYYAICKAYIGHSLILATTSGLLAFGCKVLNKKAYEALSDNSENTTANEKPWHQSLGEDTEKTQHNKSALNWTPLCKGTALLALPITSSLGIILSLIAGIKLGYGIKITSACISYAHHLGQHSKALGPL